MQIHLAVHECALREFARFGQARTARDQRAQDLTHDDRRAVHLQFEHILAGIAVRLRRKDRDAAIDRFAALVENRYIVGVARVQARQGTMRCAIGKVAVR